MNVFLDTMVYLHFVPIEQIDFCDILGTDAVTLLVPRVTFKELDKHKASHTSSRTRDRSRQALKLLESHITSGESIRDGVTIQFIPDMPKIDMEAHGLNPAWNDDLLIASVLEFKLRHPSIETVFVTHDTGARLTCRNLGIKTIELPDTCRLPPELDESEKENQRLRRELQKLQNALPTITIGFADEIEPMARFSLEPPDDVDESRIADTLTQLKNAVPELPKKGTPSDSGDALFPQLTNKLDALKILSNTIPQEEYDRYNSERVTYFEQYEQYLRELVVAENVAKRSIRFTIAILNSGSAPADDVDVYLYFPDGFSLYIQDDFPPLPGKPKPPAKPRGTLEMHLSNISMPNLTMPQMHVSDLSSPSSFQICRTNSYKISDHFSRIKHGFMEKLPELFLTFDSYCEASSFNCDYEISVGNLPEPIKGKLHFVIDKNTTDHTPKDA